MRAGIPMGGSGIGRKRMSDKGFFDTNVLLYGVDESNPEKQRIASMLIEHAGEEEAGCVSTQVLQEYYSVSTRKLKIDPLLAKEMILFLSEWTLATITPADIQKAIDGNILWQVSFWDALILVAAAKLKCNRIYTEDLNHGQIINGVKIINPFLDGEIN